MLTPQDIADVFNAAGYDTKAKFAAFLTDAIKPVRRAAKQAEIDSENATFASATQTHNQALATLQQQLNAI